MGSAASKRKALRSEAMSSVAAKVRAARAFGEYLSQNHPEGRNGSDHLLADSYLGQEDSPELQQAAQNKRRLSVLSDGKLERSFSEERAEQLPSEGLSARVYTISGERPMLSDHGSESLELVVMKGPGREACPHGRALQGAGSSHSVGRHCKGWAGGRQGSRECPTCARLAAHSQHSFDLEQHQSRETGWRRKKLERMYSIDRVSDDVPVRTWFPKENLFTFQTATTTMQALVTPSLSRSGQVCTAPRHPRGHRKRRKLRQQESLSRRHGPAQGALRSLELVPVPGVSCSHSGATSDPCIAPPFS